MNRTRRSNPIFEHLAASPDFTRFSEVLADLAGIAMTLLSPEGEFHIPFGDGNKNRICRLIRTTEKGASRCNACDLRNNLKAGLLGKPLLYRCHAGFYDINLPIFVQGRHVASISSGQLLTEPPSQEGLARIRRRLAWLNAAPGELRRAYWSAPYLPEEKIRCVMRLLEIYSVQLCESLHRIRDLESRLERTELRKAKEYVAERFTDPDLGLVGAASHAGLSPAHFSHLFRRETGVAFTRYVQRVRLEEAKRLLKTSEQSVSEICFACGFNSLPHFIRVFRTLERTTPGRFRRPAPES